VPSGKSLTLFASIGKTGGLTGSRISFMLYRQAYGDTHSFFVPVMLVLQQASN